MSHGSRVCPHCGKLNSAEDSRCFHCGRSLPGPVMSAVRHAVHGLLGEDFPMNKLVIGLCLLVFALCVAMDQRFPLFGGPRDAGGFRLSTIVRFGALVRDFGHPLEPWRYLSAVFVHGSLLHIFFNLMALTSIGGALEKTLGSARYLVVFVVCGVLGFVIYDYWERLQFPIPGVLPGLSTLGASGAVFGMFGARIGVLLARGDPEWKAALLRDAILIAILALAFPVNTPAHIGGAVVGLALGLLFEKERRPARLAWLMRSLAVVASIASVASIVLSNASPLWKSIRQDELYRE